MVALFGGQDQAARRACSRLGADCVAAGLPPARARRARSCFRTIGFGRSPADSATLVELAAVLARLEPRVRARDVYVPLAVGGHIDHRLAHEAALQTLGGEPGRNVYLYEERPEAFVPGAVRVRLGLLGARLPAGATGAARGTGLARYLLGVHQPPALRGDLRGWSDRLGSFGPAAWEWRSARAWNPQKAFGPRLQPLLHSSDASTQAAIPELWNELLPPDGSRLRSPNRIQALTRAYAQALGAEAYAERYWLLLPALDRTTEPTFPEAALDAVGAR